MARKKTKKRELSPAQKAQRTRRDKQRRANALARRRAAAARKGWETRRAKAKRKKEREKKPKGKKRGQRPPAPAKTEVTSAARYAELYDQYEDFDFEFVDEGEIDGGVDY